MWCLGDIVGYGPEPQECIALLGQTNHVCVAGNNDWATIGKINTSDFNPDAAAACHWTAEQLSPEGRDYLGNLPLVIEKGDFTLVHGSPREPIWKYILSPDIAKTNLTYFKSPFCLIGHSHVPLLLYFHESGACSFNRLLHEDEIPLGKSRLIINPGGVGQPRDGDPRASYAIYDSESKLVTFYRVPYDISTTQATMVTQELPKRLIPRLSYRM